MTRVGWIVVLVGLVFLFVIGGCSTSGTDADGDTSAATTPAPEGISELIDDYLASWENKDEAALRATVADGFVVNEYIFSADTGKFVETVDDDADGIASEAFRFDWQNNIVGESVVSGIGPWTVRHRELWQQQAGRYDGIATYTVIEDNGTLKISRHSWAGFIGYEF